LNDKLTSLRASFERALARLDDVLAQPRDEYMRDSAIQRFEFTFELFWKALKARCEADGVRVSSPREALRGGFQLGLLPDDEAIFRMLEDRNLTSHTYNETVADGIYSRLAEHARRMRAVLAALGGGRD
jgi:nucleotidyltransferase substrate binding protein (TIGR01987 family)